MKNTRFRFTGNTEKQTLVTLYKYRLIRFENFILEESELAQREIEILRVEDFCDKRQDEEGKRHHDDIQHDTHHMTAHVRCKQFDGNVEGKRVEHVKH